MAGASLTTVYLCLLTLPLLYLRYYPFRDKIRFPRPIFFMGLLGILGFECFAASRVITQGHFFFVHYVDGIRLLSYFFYFAYSCIAIKDSFFSHIFSALLVMIFTGALTLPCSIIEFFYTDVNHILFYRSLILVGEMSLFLFFGLIFSKRVIVPIIEKSEPSSMKLCSCILFLILVSVYLPTWNVTYLSETPLSYIVIRISGILEAVVTTLLYRRLLDQYEHNARIKAKELDAEKFIAISKEHFKSVEEKISATRRLKHDFKHELILIQDLAKRGETEKIVQLIQEETSLIREYSLSPFSKNYELNVILSYYNERAKQSDIDCNILCDIPEILSMTPEDLWIMIGNLYLNAIEACERMEQGNRQIDVVMKAQGNLIIIMLKNTFNIETLMPQEDKFSSSKTHGNCGNGLKSIQLTAEKYGGKSLFEVKGDRFISTIYLYL